MPLLALDLVAAGLFIGSLVGLIVCVIVGGLLLGILNTVLTECVMEATDLPRSVASSAYSGVRFLGGAIAPPAATLLAATISRGDAVLRRRGLGARRHRADRHRPQAPQARRRRRGVRASKRPRRWRSPTRTASASARIPRCREAAPILMRAASPASCRPARIGRDGSIARRSDGS